jgi:thiamine kinase-like enzyme
MKASPPCWSSIVPESRVAVDLQPLLARAGLLQGSCHVLDSQIRPGGKTILRLRGPNHEPLKVRSFPTPDAAAAMVRLRGLIGEHPGFSQVLAWSDTLVLEEWVEGASLATPEVSTSDAMASGALLAELHQIPLPPGNPQEDPVHVLLEQSCARLQALSDTHALPACEATRLVEELRARSPRQVHQGLIHFDFCGENLVWSEQRGVVSIDNERLRLGPLAYDLGRTMALWPLTAEALAAFLSGYRAAGGQDEDTDRPFWWLMALVTSAWFRVRQEPARADRALLNLRGWGPDAKEPSP